MTTDWIAGWQGPQYDWNRRKQWGVRFLVDTFNLNPSDRVIDLGCGPLCLGSWLIQYLDPGHYTGVDRDATLLGAGEALIGHLGLAHKDATLIHATDLSTTNLDGWCDVLWSHSVLIHMDPPTVAQALDFMARHLSPHGVAYFTMNLGPHKILGEWTFGPNYQHPLPEHPNLKITELASLESLGDVVWCPPGSGMRATMLRATHRRNGCPTGPIAN